MNALTQGGKRKQRIRRATMQDQFWPRNFSQRSHRGFSISERRLWTAVLVKAVDDWRSGNLRARREAQEFLLEDTRDFSQVCAGAGIDPDHFRAKLQKVGSRISMCPDPGSARSSRQASRTAARRLSFVKAASFASPRRSRFPVLFMESGSQVPISAGAFWTAPERIKIMASGTAS